MKATIKLVDGKIVELDGSQEEIAAIIGLLQWPVQPISVMSPFWVGQTIPNTICEHEFPQPWNGIMAPNCTKCGTPALSTITYTTIS